MTAFRLIPRNVVDEGLVTSSPVALATKPASNIQAQERKYFRSTSLAAQDVTIVLPANARVSAVAVGRHNLTTAGTIQARLYSDTGASTLLQDSTALAAFNTTGLVALDVDKYLTARFRGLKNWVYYFPSVSTTVRAIKISTTDGANPDGFMEYARVSAGEYFEAAYMPALGSLGLRLASMTTQRRAEGGSLISDLGAPFRAERMTLDKIVDTGDLASMLAIARELGYDRDFWYDLYPTVASAEGVYHRGFYKFTDLGPIEPHFGSLSRKSLAFEES